MWRSVLPILEAWRVDKKRKPLFLRGARQVGKSWLAREFGKSFDSFVELNLEERRDLLPLFEGSMEPKPLLNKIAALTRTAIEPGKTLFFIDEIQTTPRAILFLRYLYEKMPKLHVIAAGSLIEFALEKVGMPVGRLRSLYIHPMSFFEFVKAVDEESLFEIVMSHDSARALDEPLHRRMLEILSEYLVCGGMPEAVTTWRDNHSFEAVADVHTDILDTYRQDFEKYTKRNGIYRVEKVFMSIPNQMCRKFVYSRADETYRARELSSALELLVKAGVAKKVFHSSSNGVPLMAEQNPKIFKVLPLDVGMVQTILGLKRDKWLLDFENTIVNRGTIAEVFVGMELIAYEKPTKAAELVYWVREKRTAMAEVDYVISSEAKVIPVEVKSGTAGTLKSMHVFLKEKPKSPFGVHFTKGNFARQGNIRSYPLYAVKKALFDMVT